MKSFLSRVTLPGEVGMLSKPELRGRHTTGTELVDGQEQASWLCRARAVAAADAPGEHGEGSPGKIPDAGGSHRNPGGAASRAGPLCTRCQPPSLLTKLLEQRILRRDA